MKGKLKIGDRVIVNGKYDGLEINNRKGRGLCTDSDLRSLIEFDESFSYALHGGAGKGKASRCWWIDPKDETVKIEIEKETIVIYHKGNDVIALDKTNNKKAVARCNPEDTFDFETGARLAFERLFEKPKYNARVVCIRAETECFTDGKIYEVKDGFIYGNRNRPDNLYPFENFEDLSRALRSSFIEIKED